MSMKTKLNLPADWIISFNNTEDANIDLEYYILKLKAYESKVTQQISDGNFYGFIEHIYHSMNLNSFLVDGLLYDTSFKKIEQSNYLPYVNNIKAQKETSNILSAIKVAQDIFKSLLLLYLDKMPKDNTLVFNNHNIHSLNIINILVRESESDMYQLWEMKIGNTYEFMNNTVHLSTFELPTNADTEALLKSTKDDIHKNNMIGVEMINTDSVDNTILGIRDTLLLNRIFKTHAPFTASLYIELSNYIKSTGRFDYRFKVS